MTPSQLKANHLENNPDSLFFSRKTMTFFGDTMGNYGVKKEYCIKSGSNEKIPVWTLYRKKPVKCGNDRSTYFSVDTFSVIHNIKEIVA